MTKEVTPSPTRLIHNQRLGKQWLNVNNVTSSFPGVAKQVPTIVVNRHALFPNGYNPSLIRHQDQWLMTYRWHPDHTAKSCLAIALLDGEFNVVRNEQLHATAANVEDARCFIHNGALCTSYVESKWPEQLRCLIKYGRIERSGIWRIADPFHPEYGRNDGEHTEKNWAFFEYAGKLLCLYQCTPEQIVLEVEGNKIVAEHKSKSPRWKWGLIKSGVSPLFPYDGKWLRFFHSRLDNEPHPYRWRYYLGASLMEPEPPYRTIAVSTEPIARGSEEDDLSPNERSTCTHRKPNVIFPAGAAMHGDGFLISIGINDCESALIKLQPKDLNL